MIGNRDGLKPSQLKALERLYDRQVRPTEVVSAPLARQLSALSSELGCLLGLIIDRRGAIQHVIVGDAHRVYLPDLGRQRGGLGQLRGLRHVRTAFREGLAQDDYADLTKLRLDAVAVVHVDDDGRDGAFEFAHLLPERSGALPYRRESFRSIRDLTVDFSALIEALEKERAKATVVRDAAQAHGALVVGVYSDRDASRWRVQELRELALTAGIHILDEMIQLRPHVDARYVVGRGKLEEVVLRALEVGTDLVIFDHDLTPTQARSIAAFSDLKVIDRTQLILDIFAQHAKSRDGKLQVELAQLKYNLPRLTDLDAGLSRLTGGIGGRGPGETKLEINRRRARERINRLEAEIERLSAQRAVRRSRRDRSGLPVVSVVGYTNAGKSTLLNRLTTSDVLVADKLFATLDPASRRLEVAPGQFVIATDTVGFIRDLPPDLMRAFRATLEELASSDLLLHVVDGSCPMREAKKTSVETILHDLELDAVPRVLVYNKADALEPFERRALERRDHAIAVSARDGWQLDVLKAELAARLPQEAHGSWAAEGAETRPSLVRSVTASSGAEQGLEWVTGA